MITFRWFGARDPIPLDYIRQIPVVRGIVSALFDIPVGEPWPLDRITALREECERHGMSLTVIESIPVHEDIKLGRPTRDLLIDNYCESVRNGPVGGKHCVTLQRLRWTRTGARRREDGSTVLAYTTPRWRRSPLERHADFRLGDATPGQLGVSTRIARKREQNVGEPCYFLERFFHGCCPRRMRESRHPPGDLGHHASSRRGGAERVISIVDDPANGITFCGGSLAANPKNDLAAIIRSVGGKGRIHFAHCRNIKRTGTRSFQETAHPSGIGDIDMRSVLETLHQTAFAGPIRSDHGRMIWGETGQPGYGLHDRRLAPCIARMWEGFWWIVSPDGRDAELERNRRTDGRSCALLFVRRRSTTSTARFWASSIHAPARAAVDRSDYGASCRGSASLTPSGFSSPVASSTGLACGVG